MRRRQVKTIEVALGDRAYQVHIETGLLERTGELLTPFARSRRLVLVSDENVWALQGGRLNLDVQPILLPPGEGSKSWAALEALLDRLVARGVERGDPIIAFGGGVIGDLTGFAAAILKRGCPYVQIPTTLLAQVDSSVGGKTGINSAAGKNMVGAFHQPSLVLIDPECLDTLPPRELRAGYAEVAKYGLLGDAAFFAWCEANGRKLLEGDAAAREHAIATCVAAKAAIVAADERETTGQRALLNLGHSFAHALEAEAGFSDTLLHGEAVALGLVLAFRLSAERGLCSGAEAARVATHLESTGLPTRLEIGTGASLTAHMASDKKAEGGRAPLILARGIGQAFVDRSVPLAEVADFLDRQRQMALVTN
jgi:3-dehydroquinate synthase